MTRSRIRTTLVALLGLLAAGHLVLLWFGYANVMTLMVLMGFGLVVADMALKRLAPQAPWAGNWRLLAVSVFCCTVVLELVLRYGVATHLSYNERNGAMHYVSPYRQVYLDNLVRRFYFGQTDVGLRTNRPNATISKNRPEFSYEHRYNSLGLRDEEHDRGRIDASRVVIGIGDSFAEGVGAPQDSTWPALLGVLLQHAWPNALAINAGSSGSDVFFGHYLLQHALIDHYHPDVVVVGINSSDIHDVTIRGGEERFLSAQEVAFRPAPWWEPMYAASFIVRHILHDIFGIQWHLYSKAEFNRQVAAAEDRVCSCIVHAYGQLAKEKDFELVVLFQPLQDELNGGDQPYVACRQALKADTSLVVVDAISAMDSLGTDELNRLYWPIDLHLNGRGNGFTAQLLFDRLTLQDEQRP
jgi:hypothetical protein